MYSLKIVTNTENLPNCTCLNDNRHKTPLHRPLPSATQLNVSTLHRMICRAPSDHSLAHKWVSRPGNLHQPLGAGPPPDHMPSHAFRLTSSSFLFQRRGNHCVSLFHSSHGLHLFIRSCIQKLLYFLAFACLPAYSSRVAGTVVSKRPIQIKRALVTTP